MGSCWSIEEEPHRLSLSQQELNGINPVSPNSVLVTVDGSQPLHLMPELKDALIFRALYDFDAMNDGDLSFRKGDKLEVDEKTRQNSDWWVARHLTTGCMGYVPTDYITKDDNSPQSQDWWCNVEKREADRQLLLPGNPSGTFLVREAGDTASFTLSVRDFDIKSNSACVKHYRVRRLDNGGFYISAKKIFDNMLELVLHYSSSADGLCCKLEIACPKVKPLVHFRELEAVRESVKLLKKLGSGSFSDVYAGKWQNTVDVAVKTLRQCQMTAEDFLVEAKLMHQLRHSKLVQLIDVCTKSEPFWIITEFMINGALLDYLRKDEGKSLNFIDLTDMAGQIADGMAYLEMKNYVHRDLRAANILVGEHNKVKVADFGLARLNQEDNTTSPRRWMAPEAVFDGKFSIKSDVWSYGILLYEMITFGLVPYPGMNGHEVVNKVEKGYRMQKPTSGPFPCPDPYYEIILKCWNQVAECRLTFAYLEHFFNNYLVATESNYGPIQ